MVLASTITEYLEPKMAVGSDFNACTYAAAALGCPFKKPTVVVNFTDPLVMLLIATVTGPEMFKRLFSIV